MTAQLWAVLIAAFLASAVEFVEAFTIVLVVGVTINWRSAFVGAAAAVVALAAIVGIFGTAIVRYVPLDALRLLVGFLLVLFGLKWLKKSVLRSAGLTPRHDEEAIYEQQMAELRARGETPHQGIEPFGVATSFKSVLLEGLEVAFIVITFGVQANSSDSQHAASGAQPNGILVAALGALAAGILVVGVGAIVQAPLQRVPENALKFVVGLMLTTFGTFWGGEGAGIEWPGEDLFLFALLAFYLALAWLLILWLRSYADAGPQLMRAQRQQQVPPAAGVTPAGEKSPIVRAVRATYNFFAGDAIILSAVVLAFVLTSVLLRVAKAPVPLAALLFVGLIAAGLVAALGRELVGRPRRSWSPSGWSDLGERDLDTGVLAAGPIDPAAELDASFPDGNNVAGTVSTTGVPTGLPFESAVKREMDPDDTVPAHSAAQGPTG